MSDPPDAKTERERQDRDNEKDAETRQKYRKAERSKSRQESPKSRPRVPQEPPGARRRQFELQEGKAKWRLSYRRAIRVTGGQFSIEKLRKLELPEGKAKVPFSYQKARRRGGLVAGGQARA